MPAFYLGYVDILIICDNLAFDDFTGAYRGSLKQPDHFLRVDTDDNPRIVVESGWSESFPHLRNDKDLWLRGNTSVVLVILLKWSAISNNRIKGTVEIWRRGPAGNNTFVTMVTIYLRLQRAIRHLS